MKKTPVPFIDLKPVTRLLGEDAIMAFHRTLDSCEFINAPAVERFEEALAKYLEVPHVVACASGTDALILALRAWGIGPGMTVAMPNLTFWATYEAVRAVGASAVLIDVDADLQMDFVEFARAFARGPRRVGNRGSFDAAILVHLFGWASPRTQEFRNFCAVEQIPLIEDAAQAIGVRINHGIRYVPLLKYAETAALSFHPAKVLGGIMDGGAVTVRDKETAELLRSLRNHGRGADGGYDHVRVGMTSRMSAINASYLRTALEHLDERIGMRLAVLDFYRNQGVNIRYAPFDPDDRVQGNGYLCVAECTGPKEAAAALREKGIETARIYPSTIADQPGTSPRPTERPSNYAMSRAFCSRVINLPLYWGIPSDHVKRAASAFLEATRR